MAKLASYSAVVESGSCDNTYTYWEERRNCGHAHRTIDAAEACGAKHYGAKYVNGSWQASAAWHGYTVHDQDARRPQEIRAARPRTCVNCGTDVPAGLEIPVLCGVCDAKFARTV